MISIIGYSSSSANSGFSAICDDTERAARWGFAIRYGTFEEWGHLDSPRRHQTNFLQNGDQGRGESGERKGSAHWFPGLIDLAAADRRARLPEAAAYALNLRGGRFTNRASARWYRETDSGRVRIRRAPPWETGGAA